MDSPKQRAIEALEKALKPLIDAHNAATDRFGEDDAGAANIFTGIDCIGQALSDLRSQPDHGVPVAWRHKEVGGWVVSKTKLTGDSEPLYTAPPQQLDVEEWAEDWLEQFIGEHRDMSLQETCVAFGRFLLTKAAAPRPHREPSVEKKEPTCLYCDAPVAQQGQQCSACADDDGDHFGVAGK